MRSERDDTVLIHEIQEAIAFIHSHMGNLSAELFQESWLVRDAVSMRLVVIGEAASRLSDHLKATLPEVNWRGIIGLRHLLAHDYGGADPDVLWVIASERIAELKMQLGSLHEGGR